MAEPVSIIIPTYQGERWLNSTLGAIREQDYAGEVTIVAIDSSSTDGTQRILQEYGAEVTQIPKSDFTHGYARNLGVKLARTELIVFLSQDAVPATDKWLTKLVSLLDDPQTGAAHIQQLPRSDATALERFFHYKMYPSENRVLSWDGSDRLFLQDIFFSNVCSITRRELLLKYPFDEKIIMSEDQLYAKSLFLAGYQILYSSDVAVVHSHHYSLLDLFKRNFDSAYSLKGVTDDSFVSNMVNGIRFIVDEVSYMIKNKHWLSIAQVPFYELFRITGRMFGNYADRLPQWVRLKMSLHKDYWLQRE